MTQSQHLALRSRLREEVDPRTGRTRLVRGTGEILERLVTREEHAAINRGATAGDGSSYAVEVMRAAAANAAAKRRGG